MNPEQTSESGRILVVDDEETILAVTSAYLRGLGFEVDGAGEREEAEALLAVECYSVVILDMQMTGAHGREGLELLRFLREQCPWARTIVVTAHGSPELEAEARRFGACAFLHKPVALPVIARAAWQLAALEAV
jgi:DNA-binding NtrC family response regulator